MTTANTIGATRSGLQERRVGVDPRSPARTKGDRDEAKALGDEIAVNARGGPDADLHRPAAATSLADEEAGADAREPAAGHIEPLRRRGPDAHGPGSPGSEETDNRSGS